MVGAAVMADERGIIMNADLVFDEKAPHEKGFAKHFELHIKPKLIEIERARLETLAAVRNRTLSAILVGVTLVVALILLGQEFGADAGAWVLLAFVVLIVGVMLFAWASGPTKRHWAYRKQAIVPEVLNFVGDFLYEQDGIIAEDILKASHLFKFWDRYKSGGLITGRYWGRAVQFVEAELSDNSGEGSSVVFKGFILAIQMRPPARHRIIAVKDRGNVACWLERAFKSRGNLKRVPIDYSGFEDKIAVYSKDGVGGRQLITPVLIQAVTRLGELRYAETIEFGVNRDAFLLTIATERALFEPIGLANSALTPEDSLRFLKDLHEVLAIIETVAETIVGQCEISQSGDEPHVCNG
jgi:hypothetical protein